MRKYFIAAAAMALFGAPAFAAEPAQAARAAYDGQELAGSAKVSIEAAEAIALNARPGKVIERELEKEPGGSSLRYSFIIQVKAAKYEVGVDAVTGAVLENAVEGDNPD